MWNRQYDVTMQTPIGARYGTMRLTVDNRNVDGILDILKKPTRFMEISTKMETAR